MEWLAENATNVYFVIGFAAFMLAGVWWIQRQIVYLIGAALILLLLPAAWLVLRNVPTAAMAMEADLVALGKALVEKDQSAAEKYVVSEFKYKAKNPEKWYAYLDELLGDYTIDAIHVKEFEVKSRDGAEAKVRFKIDARHKSTPIFSAECPWTLRREDDVWKVEKVTISKAKLKADKDVDADD